LSENRGLQKECKYKKTNVQNINFLSNFIERITKSTNMRLSKPSFRISAAAIVVLVIVFIAACHKSTTPASEDTAYATDHLITEQSFNDAESISDAAASVPSGSSLTYRTTATTISECATVTHNGNAITVDFGTKDCMCNDGRNRRGKIIITYTGAHYTDSGSVHTITFDNFYQNDNKITGTKTVTNMGVNKAGQPWFNVSINGSVALNGGGIISSTWTRIRIWTAGYSTLGYLPDDVYNVVGSGKMTCTSGANVSINIVDTLVLANNCHWVEAGSVTYTLANGSTHTLNYGDIPACDDQATMTLSNGAVKNITLP
jgi:hypothetical protein